jgi:hypothetical protein
MGEMINAMVYLNLQYNKDLLYIILFSMYVQYTNYM